MCTYITVDQQIVNCIFSEYIISTILPTEIVNFSSAYELNL
jgi:hypothetical protein